MDDNDIPMMVRLRMWAFMAVSNVQNTSERLAYADQLHDFLWSDYEQILDETQGETVH